MASGPAPSDLVFGALTTLSATTTTTSITPVGGNAYFLFVGATDVAPFTDTATATSTGLTWTKVAGLLSGNHYFVLFVGYGASPSAGGVSVTLSSTPDVGGRYCLYEQKLGTPLNTNSVDTSATTSGTGTSGAVTLAKYGRCLSFWAHVANEATNPAAGWTEFSDTAAAVPMALEAQYQLTSSRGAAASWTSNVVYAGIALKMVDQANPAYVNEDEPVTIIGANAAIIPDEPVAVTTGHWSVD